MTGWKEIAAYLNRGVRTVQRWEKEYGLPVRRFGTSKPESVFADPDEVEAWLDTAQGVTARSGSPSVDRNGTAGGDAAEPASAAAGREQRPPLFRPVEIVRLSAVAAATALIIFLAWAWWVSWQLTHAYPPPGSTPPAASAAAGPAAWLLDLDSLVVTDARGRALWKHTFQDDLMLAVYANSLAVPLNVLGGVADVDADGFREVWFVARFSGEWSHGSSALYLFEHDGRVRWTYKPSVKVRFGEGTFGPSWIVSRAFVTVDPAGGSARAIWAVLYDAALFPSALQRLDPRTGFPLSAYWSNGSIVTVALDAEGGRHRLLVGASNNERKGGSLAVLDALSPNGSAPAEVEKYRCTSCGPGGPQAFLVFPKPARYGNRDGTCPVTRITPMADGGITLGAQHAWVQASEQALAIYGLDPSLRPISVDTGDGYEKALRTLVAQGGVPSGAPAVVDPAREFLPILRWDALKQRYVKVPVASR